MPVQEITIPQMGEGLHEVRIIQFLKQPGEPIERDEPIYEIETDKANIEVESSITGTLQEWLADEGDILPVGARVGRVETDAAETVPAAASDVKTEAVPAKESAPARPVRSVAPRPLQSGDLVIPPRTRARARILGLSTEELRSIPSASGKLMPEDVERYVANREAEEKVEAESEKVSSFTKHPLSEQQKILNFRLRQSARLVIPCTCGRPVEWSLVHQAAEQLSEQHPDIEVTHFKVFAYCVARAAKAHRKFRSTLQGADTVREYEHLNMGIAVQRSEDELVTAVVHDADALDFPSFVGACQEQIQKARDGEDQVASDVQLHLSYMGRHEIHEGFPLLVAPAVGTLFIGAPYERDGRLLANLTLTFDHRLINGMGASNFVNEIAREITVISDQ